MDVKGLQGQIAAFAAERGWDHSPRILAMALAAEAGAVLGLFKWQGDRAGEGQPVEPRAPDAIADVLLQAFRLADRLGVDLEAAMTRKLAEIAAKYPRPAQRAAPAAAAPAGRSPAPKQGLREELRQAVARLGTQKATGAGPAAARSGESEPRPRAAAPRAPEPRPAPAAPARPTAAPPPVSAQGAHARAAAQAPPRHAAAPPAAAPSVPPAPPSEPPAVDRFLNLDTESAIGFLKSLSRRVDAARTDDPLLRELHDELQTLRRNLYSSNAKPAWIGASLETIRGMLEEAARHAVGEEIRAAEHLTHVRNILDV